MLPNDDNRPLLLDPTAFAEHLHDQLTQATEADRFLRFDAPAFANYQTALARLRALCDEGLDATQAVEALDEAAYELASRAHAAGIRLGVEAESLRRSLLDLAREKTAR